MAIPSREHGKFHIKIPLFANFVMCFKEIVMCVRRSCHKNVHKCHALRECSLAIMVQLIMDVTLITVYKHVICQIKKKDGHNYNYYIFHSKLYK